MRINLILLLLTVCLTNALAQDSGVRGPVWPIEEINLKQVLRQRARQLTITPTLQHSAAQLFTRVEGPVLPPATTTQTRYFSPDIVLKKPILDAKGKTLFPAGTHINPLRVIRPQAPLWIFDGMDTAQVARTASLSQRHPTWLFLVTRGNIADLSARWHRPVFRADRHLLVKLHIRALPSLAQAGSGTHALMVAITECSSDRLPEIAL